MLEIRNKIDLHLHIDGSVKPSTVYELSREFSIKPECTMTLEEITKSMVIPEGEYDPDFLTFEPALRVMQTKKGIVRVTKELIQRLEEEGLIYRYTNQAHRLLAVGFQMGGHARALSLHFAQGTIEKAP